MEIVWLGHSCFRIRGKEAVIVTDPFDRTLGYDITVENTGSVALSNLTLTDTIPAPWAYLPGSDFGESFKVWQVGTLEPGQTWSGPWPPRGISGPARRIFRRTRRSA